MSGGSFDYLCHRSADELMGDYLCTLEQMSDDLTASWPGSRAAKDTADLVEHIRTVRLDIQRRVDLLNTVWRAQEWWRSGDFDEDDVKQAVAQYFLLDILGTTPS